MRKAPESRSAYSFPRSVRLRSADDYRTVFRRCRRISDRHFRMHVRLVGDNMAAKIGIVVSRRVSRRAVVRNRIKRQVREHFRIHQHRLSGCELVVIAQKAGECATNAALRASLDNLYQQTVELCENR